MQTNSNHLQQKLTTPYAVKSTQAGVMIKDVDLSKKIVTGYFNTFNFLDSDFDVILKGATQRSITERGPNSAAVAKIKHLMFHDWQKLPGKLQVLEEKEGTISNMKVWGDYFETKMSDTTLGQDAIINYQEGIYDNHSIGFQYLDGEWVDKEAEDWNKYVAMLINPQKAEEAGYMYVWKEIKLYEGSTVAFGANELTPYLGSKSMNRVVALARLDQRMEKLAKQLSDGKQSDEMLQSFEMQLLQIRQMVKELLTKEPSSNIKDTLREQARSKKDTSESMVTCSNCSMDFYASEAEVNSDGITICPNCQGLCMDKADSLKLDVKQLLKIF